MPGVDTRERARARHVLVLCYSRRPVAGAAASSVAPGPRLLVQPEMCAAWRALSRPDGSDRISGRVMRMVSRLSFSAQEVVEEPLNSGRDCGSVWVLDDDDLGGGFPVAHEVRRRRPRAELQRAPDEPPRSEPRPRWDPCRCDSAVLTATLEVHDSSKGQKGPLGTEQVQRAKPYGRCTSFLGNLAEIDGGEGGIRACSRQRAAVPGHA